MRLCGRWNCGKGPRTGDEFPFAGHGTGSGEAAELEVSERQGTNLSYLGFNMDDAIVGKREVRQALAYATDREG